MRDEKTEVRGAGGIVLYEAEPTRCTMGIDVVPLTWDKKRKYHGYKRTTYCKANEV
jgi:hypothetical protein